jgi:hypothetical protein
MHWLCCFLLLTVRNSFIGSTTLKRLSLRVYILVVVIDHLLEPSQLSREILVLLTELLNGTKDLFDVGTQL